jgi:hypothetical protein
MAMAHNSQTIPIRASYPGKRSTDTTEVRLKVEQDISLLTDRIASMKNQTRPNTVVIETYEAMLNSRMAVLNWLQHGKTRSPDTAVSRTA